MPPENEDNDIEEIRGATTEFVIKGVSSKYHTRSHRRKQNKKIKYSIATGIIVFCLAAFFLFRGHSQEKAYQNFVISINATDYTNALVYLEAFDYVFSSKYSKYNAEDSIRLPTAEERKQFIVELIEILDEFKNSNYLRAIKDLKNISTNITKLTAGANNNRSKFNRLYLKYQRSLTENYKQLRRKEIIYPKIISENEKRMYQQSILSQDLANEFGLLMGLSPEKAASTRESIKFYHKGILAGLPKLKRLPDNIKDLQDLKAKLKKAGGEVRVRGGSSTPDLFLKNVNDLKEKCSVFDDQIGKLNQDNRKMKRELKQLQTEFYNDVLAMNSGFNSFIIEYVKPE